MAEYFLPMGGFVVGSPLCLHMINFFPDLKGSNHKEPFALFQLYMALLQPQIMTMSTYKSLKLSGFILILPSTFSILLIVIMLPLRCRLSKVNTVFLDPLITLHWLGPASLPSV